MTHVSRIKKSIQISTEMNSALLVAGKKRPDVILDRKPNSNLVYTYKDMLGDATVIYAIGIIHVFLFRRGRNYLTYERYYIWRESATKEI